MSETPTPESGGTSDLLTTAEASALLGRDIVQYARRGRIAPAMRAGKGIRSPLLYRRGDVLRLRDELVAYHRAQLDRLVGGAA